MDKIYKKPLGIAIFAILLASSFTYIGGSFPSKSLVQEADAQGLQLIVSAAQNPAFQNHFFGSQIVSVINNDPGATRPDSTTVGETVKGTTLNRVHLKDGLWYSFVASQKEFLQLLDVLSDGTADGCIFVTPLVSDSQPGTGLAASTIVGGTQTFKIYSSTTPATGCTAPTPTPTSPIRQITNGTPTFVQFTKIKLMPTLPDPFKNTDSFTNENTPSKGFNPDVNITGSSRTSGADWPYIQLLNIIETDQIPIRAGSASVTLTFAPLQETILAKVDRTTDWPVNAEVILSVTDFMWNINPIEDDKVSFVLDKNTGVPTKIIYQPTRTYLKDTGLDVAKQATDIKSIHDRPNLQFDSRQILKLDTEGIKTVKFIETFDTFGTTGSQNGALGTFSDTFKAEKAACTTTSLGCSSVQTFTGTQSPVISMIESNPNTSFFETIDEQRGSRADVFAGANDRVASFNYFEIVNSTPFTTHDGFSSVDKEVYQSADRAVFTVTDADQNLRSRVSEQPDGRESLTFVKIGKPFPIATNDQWASQFGKVTLESTAANCPPISGPVGPNCFHPDAINEVTMTVEVEPDDPAVKGLDGDATTLSARDVADAMLNMTGALPAEVTTLASKITITGGAEGSKVISFAPDAFTTGTLASRNVVLADVLFGDGKIHQNNAGTLASVSGDAIYETVDLPDKQVTTFSGIGPLAQNPQNAGLKFITTGFGSGCTIIPISSPCDGSTAINVRTNVTLADLNAFVAFTATGKQIQQLDRTLTIPVDKFVRAVGMCKTGTATFTDCSATAVASTYTVLVPRYNLINVDLVRLVTKPDSPFTDILVQLNATDTVTKKTQLQLINFDTNPDNIIGPSPVISIPSSANKGVGVVQLGPLINFDWFTGTGATPGALDAGTTPNANTAELNHVQLSFTILLRDSNGEPAETIKPAETHIALLDIAGITVLVAPPSSSIPSIPSGINALTAPPASGTLRDDITLTADENFVYRIDLKEQGPNSSIFAGHMDYFTANQLDTTKIVLQQTLILGDPAKALMPARFIPPNRLAFAYTDQDVSGNLRPVAATFIYETRDGSIAWDKSSYSFGQEGFLTVTDPDLNRRPDAQERYFIVDFGSGQNAVVNYQLGKKRVADAASQASATITNAFGITGFTVDPTSLATQNPCDAAVGTSATSVVRGEVCFAEQADASLLETGPNTGVFVGEFKIPHRILVEDASATGGLILSSVQQQDLQANYEDVRDSSSVTQKFQSITNIRTTTGDLVLDRAAYPPAGIMYIEIHDNDFNTFVDVREQVDLRTLIVGKGPFGTAAEGSTFNAVQAAAGINGQPVTTLATLAAIANNVKPIIEVNVFQPSTQTGGGGKLLTLLPVGLLDVSQTKEVCSDGPHDTSLGLTDCSKISAGGATFADRFGQFGVFPMLNRNGDTAFTATESGPNTGIFEFEVRLPGIPAITQANPTLKVSGIPSILLLGTVTSPTISANQPIQVTYFDQSDSAGKSEDIEQLATYLLNTARLRTDKIEYGIGQPLDIIIEEPDFNIDSRAVDTVPFGVLDIITDKLDTEQVIDKVGCNTLGLNNCDFGAVINTSANQLRTNLTQFRESGFNTGVFTVQLEELRQTIVTRGTDVKLIYFDKTPSGGSQGTTGALAPPIRVEYTFHVASILPEIVFDKEEYTPFDRVFVSIVSPDSNQDPSRIDNVGSSVIVSSSSASFGKGQLTFPETGPNTGIFEQDFRLTPDKNRFPGELVAHREDGVTVEFRIDKNVVATKSVFVNYHVGQVMFDKDAYRIPERAVLRVIDPDQNTHPDTIDTLQVRLWSTTDRGGLLITLRETGDRTGIFEEILSFTPNEESSGTRLRVSEGDTITAKYTDNTLPAPAALNTDQVFTVEIEELFASALIGQTVPPLERAVASVPNLVDQTGAILTEAKVGSQVLIQSEISNNQTKAQPFAYIVQVKDKDGVTVSLSWVTGSLPSQESLKAAQSWIPDAAGDYTIEVFVWESVDKPTALSPERTTTVTVTA